MAYCWLRVMVIATRELLGRRYRKGTREQAEAYLDGMLAES